MRIPLLAVVGALGLLLAPPAPARGGDEAPRAPGSGPAAIVVRAEGAVEHATAGKDAALLEIGQEVAADEILTVGRGSVLSLVPVEGEGAGKVARVSGPFEGTVGEFLAAAAKGTGPAQAVAAGDVEVLRRPAPAVLEGPGITRGAGRGPLRPVYPSGSVMAPCGKFAFVSGLNNLTGGTIEIRVYGKDPASGAAPLWSVKALGSPVNVEDGGHAFTPKSTYWWKAVAVLDSGEEAVAGEAAQFTVVPSPFKGGFPPGGFEKPEERASWHLVRSRTLKERQLYLDALRELDCLVAAGGGSSVVDRSREQIAKKLGLEADDLDALHDLAAVGGPTSDRVKLLDGRELPGRLVREETDAIIFQYDGVAYRIERTDVAELKRGTEGATVSAAPWVSVASRRYSISTNAGKEFAAEAARNLEALFDAFTRTFGEELGARNARNLKARIFRDANDYVAYLKKDHPDEVDRALGFYWSKDSTLYFHRSFKDGVEVTWPVLYHEATHQILHIVCNQDTDTTTLPGYWLMEALPSYMEGLRWNGKALEPGDPSPERAKNFARLAGKDALAPLKRFTELSQAEFRTAELYDQGHALFWFLLDADGGRNRVALLKYTRSCLQNRSRELAAKKHFGKEIDKVAEGYVDWFRKRAQVQ